MSDEERQFQTLCQADEIPEGEGRAFPLNGTLVAVFRREGEYFAINDSCPHMGASLASGHFEDGVVTCPWHAWRFRVRDGTWCDNPVIKTDAYEVRIVGDEIQVRL